MEKTFLEFVDKKTRKAKRHLKLIKRVLEHGGFQVIEHFDEDEPFIFIKNIEKDSGFGGVRLYQIGETLAYRVQKEEKTHPYGKAYLIDPEEMYNDLISDNVNEEKSGKEVMKAIIDEMKKFFKVSSEAEKDLRASEFDKKDPLSAVAMRSTTGTDYSNLIYSKGNNF